MLKSTIFDFSRGAMARKKKLTAQRKYQLLEKISQHTIDTFDLEQILNVLLDDVKELVDYDAAGIFVLNHTVLPPRLQQPRQMIAGVVLRNYVDEEQRERLLRYGEGLVAHAIRTGETVIIPDVSRDPRYVVGRKSTQSEIDVPLFLDKRPIGALNLESDRLNAFSKDDAETLRFFAEAAGITIDKAVLHQNLLQMEQIESQLKTARMVQAHLLPASPPEIPSYELAAVYLPAYEIGGDYYDFITLTDNRLGLAMADVSGDGVAAALVMASFRALLRTHAQSGLNPAWVAEIINHKLQDFAGPDDFVSCFYALFEPQTNVLTYVNCGHNPPIHFPYRAELKSLDPNGPALGMFDGARYESSLLCMEPGDLVLLYTDGLTEARSAQGEFFDVPRLEKLLRENAELPADELIQTITQAARQFMGYEIFLDDVALVILRRKLE